MKRVIDWWFWIFVASNLAVFYLWLGGLWETLKFISLIVLNTYLLWLLLALLVMWIPDVLIVLLLLFFVKLLKKIASWRHRAEMFFLLSAATLGYVWWCHPTEMAMYLILMREDLLNGGLRLLILISTTLIENPIGWVLIAGWVFLLVLMIPTFLLVLFLYVLIKIVFLKPLQRVRAALTGVFLCCLIFECWKTLWFNNLPSYVIWLLSAIITFLRKRYLLRGGALATALYDRINI